MINYNKIIELIYINVGSSILVEVKKTKEVKKILESIDSTFYILDKNFKSWKKRLDEEEPNDDFSSKFLVIDIYKNDQELIEISIFTDSSSEDAFLYKKKYQVKYEILKYIKEKGIKKKLIWK